MKRLFLILSSLLLVTAARGESKPDLVILFTHDLHSHILPDNVVYDNGGIGSAGGYARIATAVKKEREEYGSRVLLLDAGDFSEGTLFHTVLPKEAIEFRLMGMIGYDATTFGNHDFDFHPEGLASMLNKAKTFAQKPDVVASNILINRGNGSDELTSSFKDYPVKDYSVIKRGGIRIGIFGLLGKDASDDTPFAGCVSFTDPVERAKAVVEKLKKVERADLIVCLSHSGTSETSHSEDEDLAKSVPGIDLIISGHTHRRLEKPVQIGETLIASVGSYGHSVGRISLSFPEGKKNLIQYELIDIGSKISEDPSVKREIEKSKLLVSREYLSLFSMKFDQRVAETSFSFESIPSLYKNRGESGLSEMITDSYIYAVKRAEGNSYRHVDVAIDPIGTIRSSFTRGVITAADIFQALPIGPEDEGAAGNTLVSAYLTGRDLRNALEIHASLGPIKDDAYLQVSGARFRYNPNRMIFNRIYSVEIKDEKGEFIPLDNKRLYRIAVNSFVAPMLSYVDSKSKGILSITLRDRDGNKLTKGSDISVRNIENGKKLREWEGLAWYMHSFSDINGNGIPDIPDKYKKSGRRIIREESWSPAALVKDGTWVTYFAVAMSGIILIFTALISVRIVRRF